MSEPTEHVCKHCGVRPYGRKRGGARGLCWHCYRTPEIREMYPTKIEHVCSCGKKFLGGPLKVYCADCKKERSQKSSRDRSRKWDENNPGRRLEANRKYYANNSEKRNENARRWREKNPGKVKERWRKYYEKNREYLRECLYRWREKNPAKLKEIQQRFHERNKDAQNEYLRSYRRQKNLERLFLSLSAIRAALNTKLEESANECDHAANP